ncbi:DUF4430 domain-containing protein [Streptomyces sp. NBC_01456]|uniref:hypothetical protein n=1 Tax=unclassified Streptomyces TaxID=2593676 RepID=UPI002E3315C5|nr:MULTISPECIES: hypothetical protein [unclassified Streptomyces]
MPHAPARRAVPVTAAALLLPLALSAAAPAGADTSTAAVRVAVTGGSYTASVGLVRTGPRSLFGGLYCAADGVSPTPLTALVDADRIYGLGGVRASWDTATQDYVVTEIHGDVADSTKKWNAYVNEKKITTGPCHTAIKGGDKVRWTLEAVSGAASGTGTAERPPRRRRER